MNPLPKIQNEQRDWSKLTKNTFICWYVNTKIIYRYTAEKNPLRERTNEWSGKGEQMLELILDIHRWFSGILISYIALVATAVPVAFAVAWHLWLGLVGFFLLMACAHDAHTRTQSWICGLNMNMFISSNQYYEKREHMWRMPPFVSLSIRTHIQPRFWVKRYHRTLEQSVMASILMWTSATGWVSACLWILLVYVGVSVWLLSFSHIQIHFALAHGYTEIR